MAAVEMKQLVPVVIFSEALTCRLAPKADSEVMLAITASIKKKKKKRSQPKTG